MRGGTDAALRGRPLREGGDNEGIVLNVKVGALGRATSPLGRLYYGIEGIVGKRMGGSTKCFSIEDAGSLCPR